MHVMPASTPSIIKTVASAPLEATLETTAKAPAITLRRSLARSCNAEPLLMLPASTLTNIKEGRSNVQQLPTPSPSVDSLSSSLGSDAKAGPSSEASVPIADPGEDGVMSDLTDLSDTDNNSFDERWSKIKRTRSTRARAEPVKRARRDGSNDVREREDSVDPLETNELLAKKKLPTTQDRKEYCKAGIYSLFYKQSKGRAATSGSKTASTSMSFQWPQARYFGNVRLEEQRDFLLSYDIFRDYSLIGFDSDADSSSSEDEEAHKDKPKVTRNKIFRRAHGGKDMEQGRLRREWQSIQDRNRRPEPYKIIASNAYPERQKQPSVLQAICFCKPPAPGEVGCGDNCINRVMAYMCDPKLCPCKDKCTNGPLQTRKSAAGKGDKEGVAVFYTGSRGFGLKATLPIKSGAFIMEYKGEVISINESYRRVKLIYPGPNYYLLSYDDEEVLDAGLKGNATRFINHSCDPNCEVVRLKFADYDEFQIGLFALRDISPEEEITYNYGWQSFSSSSTAQLDETKQRCYCGARKCSGWLGRKESKQEAIVRAQIEADAQAARLATKQQKAALQREKREAKKLALLQGALVYSKTMPPKKRESTDGEASAPLRKSTRTQAPSAEAEPAKTSTSKQSATKPKKAKDEADRPPSESVKTLSVGETIPEGLVLKNESGEEVNLTELVKSTGLIIFVYPKASTPGCTTQACGFRDNYDEIKQHGYEVFGLSMDSAKSQSGFVAKQALSYHLLCDPEQKLIRVLGASKTKTSVTRSHFVIGKGGKLVDVHLNVKAKESPSLALKYAEANSISGTGAATNGDAAAAIKPAAVEPADAEAAAAEPAANEPAAEAEKADEIAN
ncbi:uncharacterized protein L969DRAFT_94374 [Mixia osmundae IAM 14324]|uniref:thioredoxin-dependent peroxiredoxin n=1 Tax=Mixia osmundae (strain CBS 9802 / IAM 14324 / JCM 22182 / KY 12970) TaxID=764103 RepID=G7E3A4_MIXOS|nr:uncharacterized protein L969DRAFT_94374 [Mixia osmundae IAM 14324]KEI39301.1 hypothetical protein L969DRAFT_94374 [Mixia osmundae IAM 14324]GAA97314.1 hypothetical protein E5Q_03992 [Mixia osmundae IAM 14324]